MLEGIEQGRQFNAIAYRAVVSALRMVNAQDSSSELEVLNAMVAQARKDGRLFS